MKARLTNIAWDIPLDIDHDSLELPTCLDIEIPPEISKESYDSICSFATNKASDLIGWCISYIEDIDLIN